MDGQLADESEASCVAEICVKAPELDTAVLHQVDGGKSVDVGDPRAFDQTLVSLFKDGLSY